MSRIHEALRRAELDENSTADLPATPAAGPADAITALAREPFPTEPGGARLPRHEPAMTPGALEESRAQDDTRDAPVDEGHAGKARRSLFERIDVRLAEKVVADENMPAQSREQYRRLAGVLLDAQGTSGVRVVMVASAVPGEGKTLTAANVALTLSESYRRRVLLIDADLRKPTVHDVFRINAASGLSEGLDSTQPGKLVVRQVSAHLSVLPAGRPTSDPMAALTSERMRRLLDEAKDSFDWVIIDTPPLMLLPDAHLLSSLVDGALLVIKANSTPHELVKRTADIIGRTRVLGVVLNQAEVASHTHYSGYYGGYGLQTRDTARE